ncbi:MAG: hypothetical protein NVS2B7_08760 [Herpetosiphon sp.]
MSDAPLFQNTDEQERVYAPDQLPADQQTRVHLDGERSRIRSDEPPSAAPVASVGTTPGGQSAPPNIGHDDQGGAPGDTRTEARDPLERGHTRD